MTILTLAIIFWVYMRIILPEQKRRQALQDAVLSRKTMPQERHIPKMVRETKTVNVAWNTKLGGYEPVSYSVVTERI